MLVSTSQLHLRRAKTLDDPQSAIAEYMRAIEQAVRELKEIRPAARAGRRR